MFLAALSLGLGAGLLWQILPALRTVLGAYRPTEQMRALYERPLPLLRAPLGFPKYRARGVWCFLVSFCTDVVFCTVCAIGLLLLLYDYNDGAWRLSVPVLFLLGLWLFRAGTARLFLRGNAYLALGLSMLLAYLRALVCLPIKGLARLLGCCLLVPCRKGARRIYRTYRRRVSARLCRAQLALAARGSISKEGMMSDVKKQSHTAAMDHQDPDRFAILHRACRRLWPFARMERAGAAKGRAGKAKRGA